MVRTVTQGSRLGWKSVGAVVLASVVVLWHILACVESPMSFSPTGDLAFTVMDPYDLKNLFRGQKTYRLLVLGKDGKLRELERTSTHMLTGPGYSGDGKRLAYLRIALPTKADVERAEAFMHLVAWERARKREAAEVDEPATDDQPKIDTQWMYLAPPGTIDRAPRPVHESAIATELSPKGREAIEKLGHRGVVIPAELVVRDAASGAVTTKVAVDSAVASLKNDNAYLFAYLLDRAQFLPDGKRVAAYLFPFSFVTDVSEGKLQLFSYGWPGLLSPDGRQLASLSVDNPPSVQLSATDGSRTINVKLPGNASPSGLAWIDDRTLAVLEKTKSGDNGPRLWIYTAEGVLLETSTLATVGKRDNENSGELAASPDGRYLVASVGSSVQFLDRSGQVLATWQSEQNVLVQPTFTPDSKRVAFKLVSAKAKRAVAIVFFSPQGRQLSRVPIPLLESRSAGENRAATPRR